MSQDEKARLKGPKFKILNQKPENQESRSKDQKNCESITIQRTKARDPKPKPRSKMKMKKQE